MSRFLFGFFLPLMLFSASLWADELPLWPLPSDFNSHQLAGHMRLNGVPLQVVLFSGVAKEESFQKNMEKSCGQQGGRFQHLTFGSKVLWSCIHEPYSQTLQWHQEGARIVGESSVLSLDTRDDRSHPILPLPGQTQVLSDLETDDGALLGRVELLRSALSLTQLRSHLLGQARIEKWQVQNALSETLERLSLRKGQASLDMTFSSMALGGSQAVLVWQKHE